MMSVSATVSPSAPVAAPDGAASNPVAQDPPLRSMAGSTAWLALLVIWVTCIAAPPPVSRATEIVQPMVHTHSLLVLPLEGHRFAGKASRMTAAALPGGGGQPTEVRFNQNVGEEMGKALEEVVKFAQLRHDGWPTGRRIELSFAEPYSPKDGPSAAVACALLLESMLSGTELDPRFAVTGDLNIDGRVRPVGGIGGKLRGAVLGQCTMVAIPRENAQAVIDLVISEGVEPLLSAHIVVLETFDDALLLGSKEKPAEVAAALATFEQIQAVARRQSGSSLALMRHPSAQERLANVLEAVPQHLSARLLLQAGRGQLPQRLSLPGSLEAIDQSSYDLLLAARSGEVGSALDADELRDAIARIRALRPRLHDRTVPLSDNLLRLGERVVEWRDRRPSARAAAERLINDINSAAGAVDAEWNRLLQDPQVVEQLMQ